MKSKQKRWERMQRGRLVLLLTAVVLVTAITGTLAWFSHVRQIQTAALIDAPDIYIEGPQGKASQLLELGDIDVSKGTTKEYVFRVVAAPGSKYRLQFAHTTNVPFVYTIYAASKSGSGYSVVTGGETFYYGDPLDGNYLDASVTHEFTYGEGDVVQTNAEPKYWQSTSVTQNDNLSYYVLRVSWDTGLKNNKETDMVYLTVKTDDQ